MSENGEKGRNKTFTNKEEKWLVPIGGIWFGAIEKLGEIQRFGLVRNNLVPKFVNSYCK